MRNTFDFCIKRLIILKVVLAMHLLNSMPSPAGHTQCSWSSPYKGKLYR